MNNQHYLTSFIGILCLLYATTTKAQEEVSDIYQPAKRYIDINLRSQEKYNKQVANRQQKLLKKLVKREQRYARKLKRNDSAGYATYIAAPVGYDSINKLAATKPSSGLQLPSTKHTVADTLQNIQQFVTAKTQNNSNLVPFDGYDAKINNLQTDSRHNTNIGNLITQRTNTLKNIQAQNKGKVGGFTGIDKRVFYTKQKIKAFKSISEEPSKAEEAAYEILQGHAGFEEQLASMNNQGMQSLAAKGASASELEKMGYQTKKQMQAQMQQKFGNNLSGVQQQMSSQITDYQEKIKDGKGAIVAIKETKQTAKQIRHIDKPTFKVNPMRGMPLRQRIEQQYNWQMTRASIDGKPAMFQLAATAGFKHSPKLTYGAGISTSIGLGRNWNNIRFSFEGIGIRTFAEWQIIYGIGAYAGYERMYKRAAFITDTPIPVYDRKENEHNTKQYAEAVLIGLTKRYRINEKLNGSLHVLYDIWWKEKGLNSPIQTRLSFIK